MLPFCLNRSAADSTDGLGVAGRAHGGQDRGGYQHSIPQGNSGVLMGASVIFRVVILSLIVEGCNHRSPAWFGRHVRAGPARGLPQRCVKQKTENDAVLLQHMLISKIYALKFISTHSVLLEIYLINQAYKYPQFPIIVCCKMN